VKGRNDKKLEMNRMVGLQRKQQKRNSSVGGEHCNTTATLDAEFNPLCPKIQKNHTTHKTDDETRKKNMSGQRQSK
jgi:hypothetical protein